MSDINRLYWAGGLFDEATGQRIMYLVPAEPTDEQRYGITPGMKLWAKHWEPRVEIYHWPEVFGAHTDDWKEAWEIMASSHYSVLPEGEDAYHEDGYPYQPSIKELVEWREKEIARRAAARKLGLPHETDEKMLAYYNEQVELATKLTPLV
jgi:hypothetical protein